MYITAVSYLGYEKKPFMAYDKKKYFYERPRNSYNTLTSMKKLKEDVTLTGYIIFKNKYHQ